jgi:hypothetical protein
MLLPKVTSSSRVMSFSFSFFFLYFFYVLKSTTVFGTSCFKAICLENYLTNALEVF